MAAAADAPMADAPADTSEAAMGAWTGAMADAPEADAPAADAPAATLEAATGAWTGAAADVPMADALAATSEVPTMGISFFSIAGVFSSGFFLHEVEKMMGQERRLQ
jgi:hypothetical protein